MNRYCAALLMSFFSITSFASIDADESVPSPPDSQMSLSQWLDVQFEVKWQRDQIEPPGIVDDGIFLRRVFLDLCGTIPSVSQTRDFLSDQSLGKREKIVDQLLIDPRSSRHLARVWRRMMVPGSGPDAVIATQSFEPWLVEQFAANTHYNELARRILVTAPEVAMTQSNQRPAMSSSPAAYATAVGSTPEAITGASTRFFLGVNLNCAKCHDHPFAKWKQKDFWGMAAFFANPQENAARRIRSEKGQEFEPVFLNGEKAEIPLDKSGPEVLVDWMTSRDNPNFGATAVNRVWQQLYGRGAVSEIDDLDRVSIEERSFLLHELGHRFAATDYDLRWLIAGLCKTRTYQRATVTKAANNQSDLITLRPLKALLPEQVFDSLEQALNLPIGRSDDSPRTNGTRVQMVGKLNEAASRQPDEFRSGIPQALMLMHGSLISNATDIETSRTLRAVVEAPFFDPSQKIETLYLAALTRKPRDHELGALLEFIQEQPTSQQQTQAYAQIFWALLNSPEFVLCQ